MSVIPEEKLASLSVLNVGAGDLHIDFDKDDPEDVEKAKGIIEDMLKRGYTILVVQGSGWRKVDGFDPKRGSYLVRDAKAGSKAQKKQAKRNARKEKPAEGTYRRMPMRTTRAIGIAPTGGG